MRKRMLGNTTATIKQVVVSEVQFIKELCTVEDNKDVDFDVGDTLPPPQSAKGCARNAVRNLFA